MTIQDTTTIAIPAVTPMALARGVVLDADEKTSAGASKGTETKSSGLLIAEAFGRAPSA